MKRKRIFYALAKNDCEERPYIAATADLLRMESERYSELKINNYSTYDY